jgi:UPF0755 protein
LATDLAKRNFGNRLFIKTYLIFYQKLGYNIMAGEYFIAKDDDLKSLLNKFMAGQVVQHKVTIAEGLTKAVIIKLLQEQHGLINDLQKDNNIKEGDLFPDTYQYVYETKISDLLNRMQQDMQDHLARAWQNRDIVQTKIIANKNAALILASIIEKEAKFADEKPMMASVYLNRLKIKMPLQADPTVVYGLNKWQNANKKVLYKDLKSNSPYNTYKRLGLPPTPICSPGADSINAVMNPDISKNLYFVLGNDGKHQFSETFAEHVRKKKKIKQLAR